MIDKQTVNKLEHMVKHFGWCKKLPGIEDSPEESNEELDMPERRHIRRFAPKPSDFRRPSTLNQ